MLCLARAREGASESTESWSLRDAKVLFIPRENEFGFGRIVDGVMVED